MVTPSPDNQPNDEFDSIDDAYQSLGPDEYYRTHGPQYRNPHEPIIQSLIDKIIPKWNLDLSHVLDLAAGSGEVTLALKDYASRGTGFQPVAKQQKEHEQDAHATIDAIDPYTFQAYENRTGINCEPITFEQIAAGAIRDRKYSLIICSFAMHLVEKSRLPKLCMELSQIAPAMVILTPHKRPVIQSSWGWVLREELLRHRVRARLYNVESKVR